MTPPPLRRFALLVDLGSLIAAVLRSNTANSALATDVQLDFPYQLDNRTSGHFWFPNSITTMPTTGVVVSRVSVHADTTMAYNVAALYTSTDEGRTFVEQTHECGDAHLSGCALPGLAHPTEAWTLSIPQKDGRALLAIPYQPRFSDGSHRRLVWNATMLDVEPNGDVAVRSGGASVRVTLELPRAVNQTWHDSDDFNLPNCNLYSGSGVALPDGSRLALLTNVRWKGCIPTSAEPCWSVIAIVSNDGGTSWQFRATVSDADDEAFVFMLEDGRLMAIMHHNFGASQPGGCQHPTTSAVRNHQSELSVACAFRQSFSSDQGHTWTKYTLMTSVDGVPPHSVMPKAMHLGKRGGYLISGGRSGLYLWRCENLACVDKGQWKTVNLAKHHDDTLGKVDPVARMGEACSNETLWDIRNCPSKGYLGLTRLVAPIVEDDTADDFIVCYDHYLRLSKFPEAMAVYCVRGRVNATSDPPFPAPSPAPPPPPTPAHHLQYMSSYDFPASECGSASGWHNLYQANSPEEVTACSTAAAATGTTISRQVTSLLSVAGIFFITGSPGLGNKGCDRVPGGCLREDWHTRWGATAAAVGHLVQNGSLLGFNLGDELLCHSLSMQNLTTAADAVRLSFPAAVIWWNECGHTASENSKWGSGVPSSVSWVSIDFPYASTSPPGAKVPRWNSSGATAVVTLAPAAMVRAYVEQWLYPKLMPHHSIMLLAPAFGSRCYPRAVAKHAALPPAICHDLDCYDSRAAALVDGFAAWAREDARVVAISPTFFHGCGYTNASSTSQLGFARSWHRDCFPQVCYPPVSTWDWMDVGFGEPGAMPKTLEGWRAVGRSIVA